MTNRKYYSVRNSKDATLTRLNLDQFKKLFYAVYEDFVKKQYLDEAFGYYCVDLKDVPGTAGSDVSAFFLRKLRKDCLWPIRDRLRFYHADDLFDVIELLFDCVSKPVDGYHHTFSDCGWHYTTFSSQGRQDEYRKEISTILGDYANGFELSAEGEILAFADNGLQPLLEANVPQRDPDNVEKRIEAAVQKFRHHRSSIEERKKAIRTPADVLEYLRPQIRMFWRLKMKATFLTLLITSVYDTTIPIRRLIMTRAYGSVGSFTIISRRFMPPPG